MCQYKNVDIIASRSGMRGSCASKRGNIVKTKYLNFIGYLKGKSMLMIYDRHPELQSKWDNVFWNRGY